VQKKKKAKKLQQYAQTATLTYSPKEKILLVGEGDFSFTAALIRAWRKNNRKEIIGKNKVAGDDGPSDSVKDDEILEDLIGFNVVSTCLDSEEELLKKYPEAEKNLDFIDAAGTAIVHKVDCTKLFDNIDVLHALSLISQHEEEEAGFDKIIFNFPHLGCGICDTNENVKQHQDLIRDFCTSAYKVLAPNGQLHITVKNGEPYQSWKVSKIVLETNFWTVRNAFPFLIDQYPGYQHRRTLGAAKKLEEVGGPKRNADINKFGARTIVFSPKGDDVGVSENVSVAASSDEE